jgi:hypothetical protein
MREREREKNKKQKTKNNRREKKGKQLIKNYLSTNKYQVESLRT